MFNCFANITLVSKIAERMGVEEADDPELVELSRDVAPERVLDEIQSTQLRADV